MGYCDLGCGTAPHMLCTGSWNWYNIISSCGKYKCYDVIEYVSYGHSACDDNYGTGMSICHPTYEGSCIGSIDCGDDESWVLHPNYPYKLTPPKVMQIMHIVLRDWIGIIVMDNGVDILMTGILRVLQVGGVIIQKEHVLDLSE